jgi:hypothetical protein
MLGWASSFVVLGLLVVPLIGYEAGVKASIPYVEAYG